MKRLLELLFGIALMNAPVTAQTALPPQDFTAFAERDPKDGGHLNGPGIRPEANPGIKGFRITKNYAKSQMRCHVY